MHRRLRVLRKFIGIINAFSMGFVPWPRALIKVIKVARACARGTRSSMCVCAVNFNNFSPAFAYGQSTIKHTHSHRIMYRLAGGCVWAKVLLIYKHCVRAHDIRVYRTSRVGPVMIITGLGRRCVVLDIARTPARTHARTRHGQTWVSAHPARTLNHAKSFAWELLV